MAGAALALPTQFYTFGDETIAADQISGWRINRVPGHANTLTIWLRNGNTLHLDGSQTRYFLASVATELNVNGMTTGGASSGSSGEGQAENPTTGRKPMSKAQRARLSQIMKQRHKAAAGRKTATQKVA
jgi:hypothetical protein